MKKTLLLFALLFIAVISSYAQDADNTAPKIDIGFNAGATVGPYSGYYPAAGGIDFKLEYPLAGTPFNLLLKTGYSFYVTANGYSTGYYTDDYYGSGSYTNGSIASFIPVEIGAKAYLFGQFFAEGEVGASFNINSTDYATKKVALIVSPGVGYTIPFGQSRYSVDLGLGYENRVETGGGFSQIGFRAAFRFGL